MLMMSALEWTRPINILDRIVLCRLLYLLIIAFRDSEIPWSSIKRNENELELSKRMQQQYMRKW